MLGCLLDGGKTNAQAHFGGQGRISRVADDIHLLESNPFKGVICAARRVLASFLVCLTCTAAVAPTIAVVQHAIHAVVVIALRTKRAPTAVEAVAAAVAAINKNTKVIYVGRMVFDR